MCGTITICGTICGSICGVGTMCTMGGVNTGVKYGTEGYPIGLSTGYELLCTNIRSKFLLTVPSQAANAV